MTRSATRDLAVGLFLLAGMAAVAYLSMSVGGFPLGRRGGMVIYAAFDQTGGLKPRAPIVISGVKVGQVDSITLNNDYRARVALDLDPRVKLPTDSSASIVTAGILGDRYIELQLGGDEQILANGDEITFTESAVILERLIGKIVHGTDVQNGNK
jgi:phospholipid/cholesterol/gamma-HCH transport system substrate-binding protein